MERREQIYNNLIDHVRERVASLHDMVCKFAGVKNGRSIGCVRHLPDAVSPRDNSSLFPLFFLCVLRRFKFLVAALLLLISPLFSTLS